MEIIQSTRNLEQFRYTVYQKFGKRADTVMDLVDAMCSMPEAKSVVEYSLSPAFRRSYSTIFKAIDETRLKTKWLAEQIVPYLPRPRQWPFWLLMVDVTPAPRPYAETLEDRGMVYQPEVVKGKLPVTIGHEYSTVAVGLEEEAGLTPSWVVPLLSQRVSSSNDKERVGAEQIDGLLQDKRFPFGRDLTVEVGDTSYSKPAYLHSHRKFPNLVTIARVRSNRTFYHQYVATETTENSGDKGHPTWYGEKFSLSDPESWTPPDETHTLHETSRRGKRYRIEIQAWHNMLMPGHYKPQRLPMNEYPFTLVQVVRYDEDGNLACKRPLWLLVMGERRHELTLAHIYQSYKRRFNLEHFFRFGKQKLCLAAFQTPDVKREENWGHLVHVAYAQLWMARSLAEALPRPWERNLPVMKRRLISPTLVQRDFGRIIRQLGTPARPPQHRGYSSGRRSGTRFPKRPRQKVVVKGKKTTTTA